MICVIQKTAISRVRDQRRRRLQISTSASASYKARFLAARGAVILNPRKRASSGTNAAAAAVAGRRKWNTGERRRHELNLGCYGRGPHRSLTHARQKRAGWFWTISHSDDKPFAGRKTAKVRGHKSELRFHEEKCATRYRRKKKDLPGEHGISFL